MAKRGCKERARCKGSRHGHCSVHLRPAIQYEDNRASVTGLEAEDDLLILIALIARSTKLTLYIVTCGSLYTRKEYDGD